MVGSDVRQRVKAGGGRALRSKGGSLRARLETVAGGCAPSAGPLSTALSVLPQGLDDHSLAQGVELLRSCEVRADLRVSSHYHYTASPSLPTTNVPQSNVSTKA